MNLIYKLSLSVFSLFFTLAIVEGGTRILQHYELILDNYSLGFKRNGDPPLNEFNLNLKKKFIEIVSESPLKKWSHPLSNRSYESFKEAVEIRERIPEESLRVPSVMFNERFYFNPGKEVVYDVNYDIDSLGKRTVPKQTTAPPSKTIGFLGCSFTFGEGLNDSESFPAAFQSIHEQWQVFNLGGPGYGPSHFLFEIEKQIPPMTSQLPKFETAVYTMLEDHIERVSCTIRYCLLPKDNGGRISSPIYDYNHTGALAYKGEWTEYFPWNNDILHSLLSGSRFIKTFNLFSWNLRDADLYLTADVLNKIKEELHLRWGTKRFVVALFPGEWSHVTAERFKNILKIKNIEFIDLSAIEFENSDWLLRIPVDGHPSPLGASAYAHLLNTQLGLVEKKP